MNIQKTSKITCIVFVIALVVILVNYASLFFPSLYVSLVDDTGLVENNYELGSMAVPILVGNIAVLIFGILFFRNIFPKKIISGIKFVQNFEISQNVAVFAVVSIIFFYFGAVMMDFPNDESDQLGDFENVKKAAEDWPFGPGSPHKSLNDLHVKNFLLKSSLVLFGNIKIIPVLGTISLILLTYFFTVQIAKKRFAGIISMVILMQSYIFLRFDTLATYANFWTLFYLLSLYLISKKWYLSPVSFIASLFSKPLTAIFLPMTFFYIFRSDIPKRKKIFTALSYIGIVAIATVGILVSGIDLGGGVTQLQFSFDTMDFFSALATWGYQIRFDYVFLIFALPVTVGLFLASRKGVFQADSILVLMSGIIMAMPLLAAMTDVNLHPYRYVPLLVFFAIGVGILFSRKITQRE